MEVNAPKSAGNCLYIYYVVRLQHEKSKNEDNNGWLGLKQLSTR